MSRTLVYIASGGYKREYESLDYDHVFLVDKAVHGRFRSDKVRLLQCDALEAFEYFKKEGIKIDCLVCLCESIEEGGHTYAMCSDTFMGYIMPILPKDFLWICNDRKYYSYQYLSTESTKIRYPGLKRETLNRMRTRYGYNFVSLDLPYSMQEIHEDAPEYLPPSMFACMNENNSGHVFRMSFSPSTETFMLPERVTIRLIQDSIWNHLDELDHLFISFKLGYDPMKEYFEKIDKVSYYEQMDFEEKLRWAESHNLNHIGFTPHYWYQYDKNYQKQLESFIRELRRPMIIDFFYMNSRFGTRFIKKAVKTIWREVREDCGIFQERGLGN